MHKKDNVSVYSEEKENSEDHVGDCKEIVDLPVEDPVAESDGSTISLKIKRRNTSKKALESVVKKPKKKAQQTANLSDTRYDVVKYVFKKQMGWKTEKDPENKNWDVWWTDSAVQPEHLAKMNPYQKINHFPGMFALSRKNHLARNLKRLKREFPEYFKFFPPTWLLPAERSDFNAQFVDRKPKTFILKPEASCQGRGIFLIQHAEEVPTNEHYVAQRYMLRPHLIDGLKYDLRIYVLLAGIDPMRIFIHKEGLARFSTEPYVLPTKKNKENMCVHLTNYAINKFNANFQQNENLDQKDVGHKRSQDAIWDHMRENGEDVELLWDEIKKMVIKTICSAQPIISHHYKSCQPDDYYQHMCFEILGFDFLISNKMKPMLLEINHTPSFSCDSPLDRDVKARVIHDSLQIMNLTTKMKKKQITIKKKELEQRVLTGKRAKRTQEEKDLLHKTCQMERDEWIYKNQGDYELVYPYKNKEDEQEPYDEFIEQARQLYLQSTGGNRKTVKKDDVVTIEAPKYKESSSNNDKLGKGLDQGLKPENSSNNLQKDNLKTSGYQNTQAADIIETNQNNNLNTSTSKPKISAKTDSNLPPKPNKNPTNLKQPVQQNNPNINSAKKDVKVASERALKDCKNVSNNILSKVITESDGKPNNNEIHMKSDIINGIIEEHIKIATQTENSVMNSNIPQKFKDSHLSPMKLHPQKDKIVGQNVATLRKSTSNGFDRQQIFHDQSIPVNINHTIDGMNMCNTSHSESGNNNTGWHQMRASRESRNHNNSNNGADRVITENQNNSSCVQSNMNASTKDPKESNSVQSHAFRIKDNAGSAYGKRKEPNSHNNIPVIENNNHHAQLMLGPQNPLSNIQMENYRRVNEEHGVGQLTEENRGHSVEKNRYIVKNNLNYKESLTEIEDIMKRIKFVDANNYKKDPNYKKVKNVAESTKNRSAQLNVVPITPGLQGFSQVNIANGVQAISINNKQLAMQNYKGGINPNNIGPTTVKKYAISGKDFPINPEKASVRTTNQQGSFNRQDLKQIVKKLDESDAVLRKRLYATLNNTQQQKQPYKAPGAPKRIDLSFTPNINSYQRGMSLPPHLKHVQQDYFIQNK